MGDPRSLNWIDPPPAAAIDEARARLSELGAIDAAGRPTAHGRAIAALPLAPRLGHMLIAAGAHGLTRLAAQVAVLLSERGLGGPDADLEHRWRRWRSERGSRAEGAWRLAERWAALAGAGAGDSAAQDGTGVALCVALAFPDRIARRRDTSGEHWASTGGRGFRLDPTSSLARHEWLAVAETQGMAAGARILSAAPIEAAAVTALFAERIVSERRATFDPATGAVQPLRVRRLGQITLNSGPDSQADRPAIEAALVEGVRAHGLTLLPWGEAAQALRTRAAFARMLDEGVPALDDAALLDALDAWLPALVAGRRRLDAIEAGALHAALEGLLGWDGMQAVNRLAPARLETPAGSSHTIDYGAEGGPRVEVRVQALFGLARHPMVGGGRVPLTLSLTSPAGRPIQTTRDLSAFWSGSWREVAKEMRGRYPKHPWPDDPAVAQPTLRTKKADARRAQ